MNIAAFDLSLTATGFATYGPLFNGNEKSAGIIDPKKLSGMMRLRFIRDAVLELSCLTEIVVLEGYAFGVARQSGLREIGELGGVVRMGLWERGTRYVEIPPASLKLFATGRGNAKKEEVLVSAVRHLDYDGHDHNVADALWLLQMALARSGDIEPTNEHQRRALEKIVWPELAGV